MEGGREAIDRIKVINWIGEPKAAASPDTRSEQERDLTVHLLASCRCAEPPRPGQQVARATRPENVALSEFAIINEHRRPEVDGYPAVIDRRYSRGMTVTQYPAACGWVLYHDLEDWETKGICLSNHFDLINLIKNFPWPIPVNSENSVNSVKIRPGLSRLRAAFAGGHERSCAKLASTMLGI
jgi:hypothetical protein